MPNLPCQDITTWDFTRDKAEIFSTTEMVHECKQKQKFRNRLNIMREYTTILKNCSLILNYTNHNNWEMKYAESFSFVSYVVLTRDRNPKMFWFKQGLNGRVLPTEPFTQDRVKKIQFFSQEFVN